MERRERMMKIRWSVLLAALLMCIGTACAQEIPALLEPVGVQMDTATARYGEISHVKLYNGYVSPWVEELHYAIEGYAGEVSVHIGQLVKQGDILMALDHEALQRRTENLRVQLDALETEEAYDAAITEIDIALKELEIEHLRGQQRSDSAQSIALLQLDIRQLQLDLEMRQKMRGLDRESLRARITQAEMELAQGVLRAPCDGQIVYLRQIEKGTKIGAYTPVMYIADPSRLAVTSAFIPVMELNGTETVCAMIGDKRYNVVQREMDPTELAAMALSGRKNSLIFDFAQETEGLQAGQYAAVCLVQNRVEHALLIPTNAIYKGEGGSYVYVLENGVRRRTDVETGVTTDWDTQILSGLAEGDVVYVKE